MAPAVSKPSPAHITSALARSLEELGFEPARIHIHGEEQGWQSLAARDYQGQFLVTIEGSSVTISHRPVGQTKATSAAAAPAAVQAASTGVDGDPMVLLRESLFHAGINPGTLDTGEESAPARQEPSSTAA